MDSYELLDFGDGRKLERFGAWILDRPSPPAEGFSRRKPELWKRADARFVRKAGLKGVWQFFTKLPPCWLLDETMFQLELKPTEVGHLGVFHEQADNWRWIYERTKNAGHPLSVLNLFAYTGGSTLACATGGGRVVHLDSAQNIVQWARRNAEVSGLSHAPIRWIVEDAMKFVRREIRRGNGYQAIILDPPAYGHGRSGEIWRLDDHLPELLDGCATLTSGHPAWLLFTIHSEGFPPETLRPLFRRYFPQSRLEILPMNLVTRDGRPLPSGFAVRIQESE
ncbi:MAG: class I SAM-dependent methyltransferase [Planctomycetia bacterium]|nr:class I SAM-dependent methyltransferase [Planctomycetia bacterium]